MKIEELVKRAKDGDNEAFSELITSLKAHLYKVAKSRLSNEEDAQDAIQEAVIKAYLNIYRLKRNKRFKYWITKILINECNKTYAKHKNRNEKLHKYALTNNDSYYTDDISDIDFDSLISSLNPKEKKIFELHYKYKFTLKEISSELNINENTIKSTLNRGKIKLRTTIKPTSLLMAILILFVAGGVAAACFFGYIKGLFSTSSTGQDNNNILMAIEHMDWYQETNMDYIDIGNGYKMRAEYLLMDEMNLYMVLDIMSETDISKFKNMYFPDLKITNENGDLICDESDLFGNAYSKRATIQFIETNTHQIKALLYMYTDSFPISKTLNIESSQIMLNRKSIFGKNNYSNVNVDINFKIDLAEKFINRHSTLYDSTDEKIEKAIVTETGFYAIMNNDNFVKRNIKLVDEFGNTYECYSSFITNNDFKYIVIANFNNTESENLKLIIDNKEYELSKK